MDASVEDQGPLKQLSCAPAQLRVPTPEAPQQLAVHEVPVHLNWHVELHGHSTCHSYYVHESEHVIHRPHSPAPAIWLSGDYVYLLASVFTMSASVMLILQLAKMTGSYTFTLYQGPRPKHEWLTVNSSSVAVCHSSSVKSR